MAECKFVSPTASSTKAFAKSRPVLFPVDHPFDLGTLLRNSISLEDEMLSGLERGTEARARTRSPSESSNAHPISSTRGQGSEAGPAQPSTTALPRPRKREGGLSMGHWVRKQRRLENYQKDGHVPRPKTFKKYVIPAKPVEFKSFEVSSLPATQGAYGAKANRKSGATEVRNVTEAKDLGLKIHPWNGLDPEPFVDKTGRVFMVLAGRPDDATYVSAAEHVFHLLQDEGGKACFSQSQMDHRRGNFPALNVGVTHGMGTLCPTYLDNGCHTEMLDRLLADSKTQRLAGFASSAFSLWEPNVYNYYKENLDKVFDKMPQLPRIFRKSIFPAAALNFGPRVCTKPHCDCKNCPFGMCAVQALGEFDPKAGGHLILWELGIAVEFPPGSTILIPSATLTHSNIHIGPHEKRASFTQYCSGGLFRWVDYGYQTEKELKARNPSLYDKICEMRPHRWRMGLDLLTKVQRSATEGSEGDGRVDEVGC